MLRRINGNLLTVLTYIAIEIAIVSSLIFVYHLMFSNSIKSSKFIESKDESSVIIDGDTTKRLYFIKDTSTGMVWIGIPGINQTK